jgi:hypothetical protein
MENIVRTSFSEGLISTGPASEYREKLMLYGRFVGDWVADCTDYADDGRTEHYRWDIRFAWVLEGRAVQDLWITPVRAGGKVGWREPGNRYSTTLRVYDPKIDAWHILWINPPSATIVRQLAREVGDQIIQTGDPNGDGTQSRWVYRDITSDSFRWCDEKTTDGEIWTLVKEMHARRIA